MHAPMAYDSFQFMLVTKHLLFVWIVNSYVTIPLDCNDDADCSLPSLAIPQSLICCDARFNLQFEGASSK